MDNFRCSTVSTVIHNCQNEDTMLPAKSGSRRNCFAKVPLRIEGTLNSPRAASPLMRLVEGEERWEAPDYPRTQLWQTKTFRSLFKAQKCIIDADSQDEDKVNNVAPDPASSEIRNIMESIRSYFYAHSNDERNYKMDDIKQVDNLIP
ncbi:hypothetical protein TNCV_615391 [Trichonephila clavipes]|nr:hypothetical protein TNCV_615391 [Trichonephila clavipes]